LLLRANISKPDGGVFFGQEGDQEHHGPMAAHLEFRWPSAWTRLAAHLELGMAAVMAQGDCDPLE
jgi:hypothetical protein